jgi:hypothetical protein
MTTSYLEDEGVIDGDDGDERKISLTRKQIKSLEAKARKVDELEAQIAKMTKQQTFTEAGIDPSDPKMAYFVKGYDGEMTSEAIKAAATEAGFITAAEPDPVQQENLQAMGRVANAAAGAPPMPAGTEGAVVAEMEAALASGGKDAVMAVARKYGATFTDDYS